MTLLEWVAVEARTGRQVAFLPELAPTSVLKRTIGRYDSCSFTLPWARSPLNVERATKPGAAWLVALLDDQPIGGWLVLTRTRSWSADPAASQLTLTAVTCEGYFDRVYVGDSTYISTGQCAIAAALVDGCAGSGSPRGIALRTDTTAGAGRLRDRTYADADDKTLYSALTDLAGVDGGPEWTVEWERVDGPTPVLRPVVVVADRLGVDPAPGLAPPTFDLPGCVLAAQLVESYEAGRGANRVTATGQKTGDDRAQATVDDLTDTDRPMFELRGNVSTSNSDTESLADHATAALAIAAPGQRALTLTAAADRAPRLGFDRTSGAWALGDTLGVDLSTPDGAHQGAWRGQARAIGWEWDTRATPETVAPILAVPDADL